MHHIQTYVQFLWLFQVSHRVVKCVNHTGAACKQLLLLSFSALMLEWWLGLVVARWSRSTKLLYAGPG